MKRFLALILSITCLALPLFGCNKGDNNSESSSAKPVVVRVGGMTGPTSIGMVGVMEGNVKATTENRYQFTITGSPDELTKMLAREELDIAAVPANLAATLYNNTDGEIRLLAVNNLGVLYVLAKGENISSVADLKGKNIYTTGKGSTPEYVLRHVLQGNGIDPDNDVEIVFKSEAAEVVQTAVKSENVIVMLPQPQVTVATSKAAGLEIALDLNQEWQKIHPDGAIVTGVLVVRKSFAESNPQVLKQFLADYKSSAEMVNASPAKTAELVEKHGIFTDAEIIEKALPYCNIKYIAGEDMKKPVNNYLGVLYEQTPQSIGGKLPKEDFFHICQ